MILKQWGLLAAGVLAISVTGVRAETIYDNSTTDLNINFNPLGLIVGDEVNFGGTDRRLSGFSFQYYGLSFAGSDETARVRIYDTNGAPFNGYGTPGNLLWDSGAVSIIPTPGSTITWDATDFVNVDVPNTVIWTVEFGGIGAGETAGVRLYDPPTIGTSLNDYWQYSGTSWALMTNSLSETMNFGARFEATVPEPGTMGLFVVGGILGALVLRRRLVG